ncbi:MAG: hypothetical protein WBC33_12720 [Conexibacter sp.]
MQRKVLGTAAVVLALGAGGCGGEDTLTKAELIKQANLICKEAIKKTPRRGTLTAKVLAYQNIKISGMRELKPPAELESRMEQYTRVQMALREVFEQYSRAPKRKGPGRAVIAEGERLQKRGKALSTALGLTACRI